MIRARVELARVNHLYVGRERISASWLELGRLWREQITIETEDRSEQN